MNYLEKAKLSDPCLLRLRVSNCRGSHQTLIMRTELWSNYHSVFRTKMEYLVVLDHLWFQREPCFMSTVGEDFEPLVEGGLLLTEQDVPTFKEAEAALLGRGVVAAGGGQDGPVQLVGDPLVLQLPNGR